MDYWLNRKKVWAPVMGLVTVFSPLMMIGAGELVIQTTGGTRFVADCNVNPVALVGHDTMTFVPEVRIVSCGAMTGSVRLNTVPAKKLPACAVPYKVLPDIINPADV